jgi:NitT/TauT family transport system ATP-binding protein
LRTTDFSVGDGAEPVLEGIDLEVKAGEFASLAGPSGSGKTSILRAVTRLLEPLGGAAEFDVSPNDVGFLFQFQDDALLPWRTTRQNVAPGLRIRGSAIKEAEERAGRASARLGRRTSPRTG